MKKLNLFVIAMLCSMSTVFADDNPLLRESSLPYRAPEFDKIKTEHYLPALKQGIIEGKAEIDAIVNNKEKPTFQNTIEALEFAGQTIAKVYLIFSNLREANTSTEMDSIAVEASPLINDYTLYISLNKPLFNKVKMIYDKRNSLGLDKEQLRLLEKTYKSFVRKGALLSEKDKETYSNYSKELSLKILAFGRNSLGATNANKMNLTSKEDLAGLPQYVIDMAAETAKENNQTGWTFDVSIPSYVPFMQYSNRRDLRKQLYLQRSTLAIGGEFDNTEICRQIVDLRIKIANLLGYKTYADYVLDDRMLKSVENVNKFIQELAEPTMPAAQKELQEIFEYAKKNGFDDSRLYQWDLSYWSEKYKASKYNISDEQLKPYFKLENSIQAVFGLATRLYGLQFQELTNLPVYHKDVHVYDVKDADGRHLALFYADFFPRASKRAGAWMTSFAEQKIVNGVEHRPLISIVTNFSKPTADAPSLLTHDELLTFMHEFGHSLHGILAEGKYPSLTGTNVDHDFVELPSQINENWGYEAEFLQSFAKNYLTGEAIPDSLIQKIKQSKNYMAAISQMGQLNYAALDMAWYTLTELPAEGTVEFEHRVTKPYKVIPAYSGVATSPTFNHIFKGGYSAGYYSYKWAEVLEADAFSLFEEKGIFNTEVSHAFRKEILSKGSSDDEAVLYRNFRGHDPQPRALLVKLGIIK